MRTIWSINWIRSKSTRVLRVRSVSLINSYTHTFVTRTPTAGTRIRLGAYVMSAAERSRREHRRKEIDTIQREAELEAKRKLGAMLKKQVIESQKRKQRLREQREQQIQQDMLKKQEEEEEEKQKEEEEKKQSDEEDKQSKEQEERPIMKRKAKKVRGKRRKMRWMTVSWIVSFRVMS